MNIIYGIKKIGETPKVIQEMYMENTRLHEIATRRINRQYYASLFLVWLMMATALYLLTS